jgi:hypothetical protein
MSPVPLPSRRRLFLAASAAIVSGLFSVGPVATTVRSQSSTVALPDRLSDQDFWALQSLAEPGGYFRITDNYTSNEGEIGQLFTSLREAGVQGGVYLGVGPEQNLTYIAAIKPAMAFIIDIRRQAAMQHLMFKAMFEMAADRAEFISLLFARPRPGGLRPDAPIQAIWQAYAAVSPSADLAARVSARVVDRLNRVHRIVLTDDEMEQLVDVLSAFVFYGPGITTRGGITGGGGGNMFDFADLTGWSTDSMGRPQSFLSSEENFGVVKSLHEKNLIVPLTGDFGGPRAIRAVGDYVRSRGGFVSAFYVSNVEQYLFQDGKADAFYRNVAALPLDARSVFIRPYSLRRGGSAIRPLCPIKEFLAAVDAGKVISNYQALGCAG